jgi:hypothetical protein
VELRGLISKTGATKTVKPFKHRLEPTPSRLRPTDSSELYIIPAVNMPAPSAPQSMMWEVSVQDNFPVQEYDDPSNPAGDNDLGDINLDVDAQIKAYEAFQAAQARRREELERRKTARRKVHFADELLLYSSNRTLQDVDCMWYSRDELAEFKNERKHIVKVLKKANFDLAAVERTGLYCLRGYEAYFSMEVNKSMKYARTRVTSVVASEQTRQRNCGVYFDDEAMRIACSGASQWALENALQLGGNDEYDAYGDDGDCCSMVEEETNNNFYLDDMCDHDTTDAGSQLPCFDDYSSVQGTGAMESETTVPEQTPNGSLRSVIEKDDENLAERLESALQLVQALRYGSTQTSS